MTAFAPSSVSIRGLSLSLLLVWFSTLTFLISAVAFADDVPCEGAYSSDDHDDGRTISEDFSLQGPDAPVCNDPHSHLYDPLACWIWKLKILIPDQEFSEKIVKVSIRDLACTNFSVQGIDSRYVPSTRNSTTMITTITSNPNPALELKAKGVFATCSGTYHAKPLDASGSIQLNVTSSAKSDAAIQWNADIVSSNNKSHYFMPTALRTTQCESHVQATDLHFSGSISAKLINLFKSSIESTVTSQIQQQICPNVIQTVDPLVTKGLQAADHYLSKYLPTRNHTHDPATNRALYLYAPSRNLVHNFGDTTTIITSSTTATTLDLKQDTPLLLQSLVLANQFLGCLYQPDDDNHLQTSCHGLVMRVLKELTSVVLDNFADSIALPLPDALHDLKFNLFNVAKLWLDFQELQLHGLDQLGSLSLLSPNATNNNDKEKISQYQTQLLSQSGLNVTVKVNITVLPIPGGLFKGDPLTELFTVQLNTTHLKARGNLDLCLQRDRFLDLQIGTLIDSFMGLFDGDDSSDEQHCLLKTIESLQIADLQLHTLLDGAALVPHLDATRFDAHGRRILKAKPSSFLSAKLEEDLDDLINHVLRLVINEYNPLLTDAIAGMVQTPLKKWINNKIANHIPRNQLEFQNHIVQMKNDSTLADKLTVDAKQCSSGDEKIRPDHHSFVNFTKWGILGDLNQFLNQPDSLKIINAAIDKWTASISKHHWSQLLRWGLGEQLSATLDSMSDSDIISFHLQDLQLQDFGRIEHIDLLSPELDGFHLRNGFSVANRDENNTDSSTLVHLSAKILYGPHDIEATLNATMNIEGIDLDGGSILLFDKTRLRQLEMSEMWVHGHCALVPFRQHTLFNNQNVSGIRNLHINASASVVGNAQFQNFTVSMDTVQYPTVASAVSATFAWTVNTLRNALNSATQSTFGQAEGYCTGGNKFAYDDDAPRLSDGYKDAWLFPIIGIFVAALLLSQLAFYGIRRVVNERQASRARQGHADEMAEPLLSYNNEEQESVLEYDEKPYQAGADESLVHSTAISAFSRHTVPICIVATIVLLFSSNLSSGATVDLYISWNDSQTVSLPALFTFSLFNTARDMWNAHIYPLFFLVLIMSGLWPYLKLVLMLGSWVMPTRILASRSRERLFLMLDSLGKFALVDTYLFVLMMVAFRYHLDLADNLSVDVFVSPETGFFTFLAATCFSLLVGHFMLYCHRVSDMNHMVPRSTAQQPSPGSIFQHKFLVLTTSTGERQLFQLSQRFQIFLIVASVASTILLAVGITQKSFRFEFGGVAGDILGDERIAHYSLVTLGSSMRKSVKDASTGVLLLEITYYFYAVATPFACISLLWLLLLCPMSLSMQRFVLSLAEIANSWSAVEVFVISIFASLLEISTFASFIIGDKCDLIDKILKDYFSSAMRNDTTCFTVKSSVEASSAVLVIAVIINSFLVSFLFSFIHCSVNERIESELVSTLEDTSHLDEDVLYIPQAPRTIASRLYSWGCLRHWIFEDPIATVRSSSRWRQFMPQSADTYSVTPDVNWDDSTDHGDNHSHHQGGDNANPIVRRNSSHSISLPEAVTSAFE